MKHHILAYLLVVSRANPQIISIADRGSFDFSWNLLAPLCKLKMEMEIFFSKTYNLFLVIFISDAF